MRRTALAFTVLMVVVAILASIAFNMKTVEASDAGNADYTIEQVDHVINVLYNCYVLINDTIRINVATQAPTDFLMGFPYVYGSNVLRCLAYNESANFPVTLDVPLENRVGFYGVKISFPQGIPSTFTVLFILSNDLVQHDVTNLYTLDFPAFPSLTKPAAFCNVSIVLPEGATYSSGTVSSFNYFKDNMPEFAYNVSQVTFSLTDDKIQVFDVEELKREISLNEFGNVIGSDTYRIKNKAQTGINFVEVILPPNASNPQAQDQFGRKMANPVMVNNETNRYKVTFTLPLGASESSRFTVKYALPSVLSAQNVANNFFFNISLFQHVDYYVKSASVSFVLPEGARVLSFEGTTVDETYSLARNVFQEMITINKKEMFFLDSFNVGIAYEYSSLWFSFRPTLWIWALSLVGCAVAVVWKRPKVPARITLPAVTVKLRPENVKLFVEAYEEKMKIISERESLETRVSKGKIPRRRYKVQKRTLEIRLSTLSKNLEEIKEKMRAVGGKYADLMRQLEIAETEANEAEANIKSIEARHSRGELSLETYRRLFAEYQRRKEKAETSIKGILLRLREEIR